MKLLIFSFLLSHGIGAEDRMINRFQIKTLLEKVFGPNSEKILNENIISFPKVFGGPCLFYSENDSCNGVSNLSKVSFYLKDSIKRRKLIATTCEKLVASNKAIISKKESFKIFYPDKVYKENKLTKNEFLYSLCISRDWERL